MKNSEKYIFPRETLFFTTYNYESIYQLGKYFPKC